MHVLVAGGAGFLGSHLCDRFLRDGHRVTCLDSLVTGSAENLSHLDGRSDFRFLRGDVADFAPSLLEEPANAILHFASPASPPEYLRHPFETIRAGSIGTMRLLDAALDWGARFLLASTSEIYGNPLVHPQTESYWGNTNPIGVRSVYDETKRFAEMLTCAWHRERGVDTAVVRIFNTYGPRMQALDGRVVPNFISQALRGEDMTIYGDGSQTRSFCYYSDLVEGLVRLLASSEHEPVNLGNPGEYTVLQVAETVRAIVGSKSAIVHRPLPQDDPTRRRPDITRARAVLGWEPVVPLQEGLRATVDWFRGVAS